MISVIIPALDEEAFIGRALASAGDGPGVEVIVADGGSRDKTAELARRAGALVVASPPGRARQMNAGARAAAGDDLVFLHADTQLPPGWADRVRRALAVEGAAGGAFRLGIDGPGRSLRLIEAMANWRSRRLGLPYGDQALFMSRDSFEGLGGFPELPVMEDYEMARRLRRRGRIVILEEAVLTSARRWRRLGPWRTTFINWAILLGYNLGLPPARLARWYVSGNRDDEGTILAGEDCA